LRDHFSILASKGILGSGGRPSSDRAPTPATVEAGSPRNRWPRRLLAIGLAGIVVGSAALLFVLRDDPGEAPGSGESDAREAVAAARHDPRIALDTADEGDTEVDRDGNHRSGTAVARARDLAPTALAVARSAPPPTRAPSSETRSTRPVVPSNARAATSSDGSVVASDDASVAGARRDAKAASPPGQSVGWEPTQSAEERGLRQVERFVANGATLEGRIVDADGGRPIAGMSVHVDGAGMFVESRTDATGAFRIPGVLPGSRVAVWVGANDDSFVDERIEVAAPADGQTADVGTLKLLRGDELSPRFEGWVGMFVTRGRGLVVVGAISPWSPADRANLEVGDQFVSIDGRDVAGLGPRAVTFLLRGPVGTSVTLFVRKGDHVKHRLTLTRVLR